jgi:hypothetical protein
MTEFLEADPRNTIAVFQAFSAPMTSFVHTPSSFASMLGGSVGQISTVACVSFLDWYEGYISR